MTTSWATLHKEWTVSFASFRGLLDLGKLPDLVQGDIIAGGFIWREISRLRRGVWVSIAYGRLLRFRALRRFSFLSLCLGF